MRSLKARLWGVEMMNFVKLSGAVLFIFSSWFIGMMKSRSFKRRVEEIKELIIMLSRLSTEISYTSVKLPDAFKAIGDGRDDTLSHIFCAASDFLQSGEGYSVADSIDLAITRSPQPLFLNAEDLNVLNSMSFAMGTSGREDQIKHIDLAMKRLEENLKEAEIKASSNAKLWPSIGFLVSCMVVLALM